MAVSDADVARLREQAEFMALGGQHSAPHWRQVAEALAELEERRAKEQKQEITGEHFQTG